MGRSFTSEKDLLETVLEEVPSDVVEAAKAACPRLLMAASQRDYLLFNSLQLEQILTARAKRRWSKYVLLHHDSCKVFALIEAVEQGFAGARYWRTLTDVWVMLHHTTVHKDAWLFLYTQEIPPGRRAAMSSAELKVFDSLPEVVTVYRGSTAKLKRGLSWTLDLRVAEFFAKRTQESVWQVAISREAVLAYYAERQESEVVVNLSRSHRIKRYAAG